MDNYFVVCDEAITYIPKLTAGKYDLMKGDPVEAIGTLVASAKTVYELVRLVPTTETVYYRYLQRTDGRTGVRRIKRG